MRNRHELFNKKSEYFFANHLQSLDLSVAGRNDLS